MKKCLFCGNIAEDNALSCPKCQSSKFDSITNTPVNTAASESANPPFRYSAYNQSPVSSPQTNSIFSKLKNIKWVPLIIAAAIFALIFIILLLTRCKHEYNAGETVENASFPGSRDMRYTCLKCDKTYDEEIPLIEFDVTGKETPEVKLSMYKYIVFPVNIKNVSTETITGFKGTLTVTYEKYHLNVVCDFSDELFSAGETKTFSDFGCEHNKMIYDSTFNEIEDADYEDLEFEFKLTEVEYQTKSSK